MRIHLSSIKMIRATWFCSCGWALLSGSALLASGHASPDDNDRVSSQRDIVEYTFDPNGPFDVAGKQLDASLLASESGATSAGGELPYNDDCATGLLVSPSLSAFHYVQQDIAAATVEDGELEETCEFLDAGISNSVWFRFVPRYCGTLSLNTNGSDYDTVLSVFQGACDVGVEIACDDDSGTATQSQLLEVPIEARILYRIKVADFGTTPRAAPSLLAFNLIGTPMFGDLDTDCDLDGDDVAKLVQECPMGPGQALPPSPPPGCSVFDFDSDGDVDLADFAEVQVEFGGE